MFCIFFIFVILGEPHSFTCIVKQKVRMSAFVSGVILLCQNALVNTKRFHRKYRGVVSSTGLHSNIVFR